MGNIKFAVVSLSDVIKSGTLSAEYHVNAQNGKQPYIITKEYELKLAKPNQLRDKKCLWLSINEKKKILSLIGEIVKYNEKVRGLNFEIKLVIKRI